LLPPSSATPSSRTWHQQRDARTTRLDRAPDHSSAGQSPLRPDAPTASRVRDDREAPLMAGTGRLNS
jgi:hypothetical protein